jgi:hypothetical protein
VRTRAATPAARGAGSSARQREREVHVDGDGDAISMKVCVVCMFFGVAPLIFQLLSSSFNRNLNL